MIHKVCIRVGCSNEFDSRDNRKIYCSRSCAATVNNVLYPKRPAAEPKDTRSKVQKWLDGDWSGTTKTGLSQSIRSYLLEEAGYQCQDGRSECGNWSGYNPKSGRSCLTVDHIDGNCMNNSIENLKVMCPNCHSMTPTYGALNKGNGRAFRYQSVGV